MSEEKTPPRAPYDHPARSIATELVVRVMLEMLERSDPSLRDRILRQGEDPGLILQLLTARGPVADGPGEVLARAHLNAELRATLDPLVAQARGAEVVVAPDGEEILRRLYPRTDQQDYLRAAVANLGEDPESILTAPPVPPLLAAGYLRSPALDPDALRTVARGLPLRDVNLDDEFELRAIDERTLAELVPSWAGR